MHYLTCLFVRPFVRCVTATIAITLLCVCNNISSSSSHRFEEQTFKKKIFVFRFVLFHLFYAHFILSTLPYIYLFLYNPDYSLKYLFQEMYTFHSCVLCTSPIHFKHMSNSTGCYFPLLMHCCCSCCCWCCFHCIQKKFDQALSKRKKTNETKKKMNEKTDNFQVFTITKQTIIIQPPPPLSLSTYILSLPAHDHTIHNSIMFISSSPERIVHKRSMPNYPIANGLLFF